MNKKYIDIITSVEYHIAYSTITKKPYIDEQKRIYLFPNETIAKTFLSAHENTYLSEKKKYNTNELCSLLYPLGANTIFVWSEDLSEIPIDPKLVPNGFYNPLLTYLLLLLRETKEKQYLKQFGKADFFVPIYIDERNATEFANIHYAYASFNEKKEKYYVVFSDLEEFNKWNAKMNNKWNLIKMNLRTINNIRKKNPIIINPFGNKVILSHELIKKIPLKED